MSFTVGALNAGDGPFGGPVDQDPSSGALKKPSIILAGRGADRQLVVWVASGHVVDWVKLKVANRLFRPQNSGWGPNPIHDLLL